MTYKTHLLGLLRAHGRRGSILTRLRQYWALAQQRHELSQLSDDQLNDLGLTRHQAESEAQRPIWDVPDNWRR